MANSFDTHDVGLALQNILSGILNTDIDNPTIPVIRANQNKTRPKEETYLTYKLLGIMPVGHAVIETDPNNTDMFRLIQDTELVVNIQAWGAKSKQSMLRIQSQLSDNPNIRALLSQVGMSVKTPAAIMDTTALLDTGYEYRDIMDVTFYVAVVEDNLDLGFIEHISIEANYQIIEGTIVYTTLTYFDKT